MLSHVEKRVDLRQSSRIREKGPIRGESQRRLHGTAHRMAKSDELTRPQATVSVQDLQDDSTQYEAAHGAQNGNVRDVVQVQAEFFESVVRFVGLSDEFCGTYDGVFVLLGG